MINGLSTGLPLTLKIPWTAELFVAMAPKPYTVSVGNATGMSELSSFSAAVFRCVSIGPSRREKSNESREQSRRSNDTL
jgi:hypothetical protein